ncbi:AMP-binding enzyme, partial [Carpediemonas membranifera]
MSTENLPFPGGVLNEDNEIYARWLKNYQDSIKAINANCGDSGTLFGSVDHWANIRPDSIALIDHSTGEMITRSKFRTQTNAIAAVLRAHGIQKGDVIMTYLPALPVHVSLFIAAMRIGAIMCPIDLRLKTDEIEYCIEKTRPKAFFFLGLAKIDLRPNIAPSVAKHPEVKFIQVQPSEAPADIIPGAVHIKRFLKFAVWHLAVTMISGSVRRISAALEKDDPCLIIFTTGSTGNPKPALISHQNLAVQAKNLCTLVAFTAEDRVLLNLPLSHIGGIGELLCITIVSGCTGVLIPVFDAKTCLEAIHQHRVSMIGQIPSMFQLEWRVKEYTEGKYDLSSLKFAVYGGQSVTADFMRKVIAMGGPTMKVATGLGLTEVGGFCTYTPVDLEDPTSISLFVGYSAPNFPLTIRQAMKEDGSAGDVLEDGEIGEICFSGPQVFLGYLNDKEATRK